VILNVTVVLMTVPRSTALSVLRMLYGVKPAVSVKRTGVALTVASTQVTVQILAPTAVLPQMIVMDRQQNTALHVC